MDVAADDDLHLNAGIITDENEDEEEDDEESFCDTGDEHDDDK